MMTHTLSLFRRPFALLAALMLWFSPAAPDSRAARAEAAPEKPFQEDIDREIRMGRARSFLYYLENSMACAVPSEESERISAYVQSRYIEEKPSNERHHMNEAAQVRFADPGAQVSEPMAFWEEKDFAEVFGVPFAKFKPSRPRPWTCLPVIQSSSLYCPGRAYDDTEKTYQKVFNILRPAFLNIAKYTGMDALTFTGNPNLASILMMIDVQYSFYATYGTDIKGYSAHVILTALDAQTHKKIASVKLTHKLGGMIRIESDSIYENKMFCAPLESLDCDDKQWDAFTEKLDKHARKQAASLLPMNPVTEGYAELFAAVILREYADTETDPWRKAVYEAGARDVRVEDGALAFRLRAFDPGLKALGKYVGSPDTWLRLAQENAAAYALDVVLPLDDQGRFAKKGLDALKSAVKKATAASKKAFDSKDMLQALRDRYFPVPVEGKPKTADDLLNVTPAFADWVAARVAEGLPALTPQEWAPFIYRINKLKLDTSGGPRALALTFNSVYIVQNSTSPRRTTSRAAIQAGTPESELRALYLRHVAEYYLDPKKGEKASYSIALDVNQMTGATLPESYLEYMLSNDFDEMLERVQAAVAEQRNP